jgi:hypothetical protein
MAQFLNRLEKVLIKEKISEKCSLGEIPENGSQVLVAHGNNYLGKEIIAKLDRSSQGRDSCIYTGNFITSKVPGDFKTLAADRYILFALWQESMEKRDVFPTLDEINKYFDPGVMPSAFYSKGSEEHDRAVITPRGVWMYHGSYNRYILTKLPDWRRASRVMISEKKEELEAIVRSICSKGYTPVEMESIK